MSELARVFDERVPETDLVRQALDVLFFASEKRPAGLDALALESAANMRALASVSRGCSDGPSKVSSR